jgi:phosphatidylserine/phosphatidylglycerophosphate/cardiolipin synthase-like enzyme
MATVKLSLTELERDAARFPRIMRIGRNCHSAPLARRAAVLVDADAYFTRLAQCLASARRSIMIVAWDFDARVCLQRGTQQQLGHLMRSLVDERPELEIRILVWSEATVHAPSATLPLLLGEKWSDHPRIRLALDTVHPLYASHHQKIITIDDTVAFVGGVDLTVDRWDTPDHDAENKERVTPDGTPYRPVHDVQIIVEGSAARCLADVARARWKTATGECVSGCAETPGVWPSDLDSHFSRVPLAVSRVEPCWRELEGCAQSFRMTIDAIEAAKDSIYLEAQYFCSKRVGEAIERSLAKPTGPEIIVVVGLNSHGFIEQYVMARNRDRLARKLRRRDRHRRFRIYFPRLPSGKDLTLHSKVMVVDDVFLRVGSSNLNNRSEGLDTECDVAIEASDRVTSAAIAQIRDALLAEHLGVTPEVVRRVVSAERSLIRAIDRLNTNTRSLQPLPVSRWGPTRPVFGTRFLDPPAPLFRHYLSAFGRAPWLRKINSESNKAATPNASGTMK